MRQQPSCDPIRERGDQIFGECSRGIVGFFSTVLVHDYYPDAGTSSATWLPMLPTLLPPHLFFPLMLGNVSGFLVLAIDLDIVLLSYMPGYMSSTFARSVVMFINQFIMIYLSHFLISLYRKLLKYSTPVMVDRRAYASVLMLDQVSADASDGRGRWALPHMAPDIDGQGGRGDTYIDGSRSGYYGPRGGLHGQGDHSNNDDAPMIAVWVTVAMAPATNNSGANFTAMEVTRRTR